MGNTRTAVGSSIPTSSKHGHHIKSSGENGDRLDSCCSPRIAREKRNASVHVTAGTTRNQDGNTPSPRVHPSLEPCLLQRKLHREVRDVQAYRNATKDGRPTCQLALRLVRVHTRCVKVLLWVPTKTYKPHPCRHGSTSHGVVGPGFTQRAQNDQNSETVPHMHGNQHKPCQDRGTHTMHHRIQKKHNTPTDEAPRRKASRRSGDQSTTMPQRCTPSAAHTTRHTHCTTRAQRALPTR